MRSASSIASARRNSRSCSWGIFHSFSEEQTISELSLIYRDQMIDGSRFFFAGEKLHVVTHAHALLWLAELGFEEQTRAGLIAQRHFVQLARQVPPGDVAPVAPGPIDPSDPDFWKLVGDPWHDIKFAHAISELSQGLASDGLERVRPALAIAWAVLA